MNVLLIGSGGREHALAYGLAKSPSLNKLFVAPGNAGSQQLGTPVELDVLDHKAVIEFCEENSIKLVIVGPEAPLVDGICDSLRAADILAFGPSKLAARLEGSKRYTKDLCMRMGIPTAAYASFDNASDAKAYVAQQPMPIVIKADGLAAGKGVVIASDQSEAMIAIDDCFDGAFGAAGAEVVIEEFMQGEEASFFVLTDGQNILPLATAQDHKRAFDGDSGPNTGGMGAYSPAPVMTSELINETIEKIIKPTVAGMREEGNPFSGVLYAGLMLTAEGPKLIEYNARFGDPECQVLMMRLESDLLPLLSATAEGTLSDMDAKWSDDVALTVVMAANGYPGAYEKGSVIGGLDAAQADENTYVFHAGTTAKDGKILAAGGRVLNVTARGACVRDAQERAYAAVDRIDWPEGFCRRDIGWRAVKREEA
ncbi:phosphoribosylamine--glycine ligase [Polycladidibacter hongkongensis]|uniref:phosphoribosylamine--glycine ligase n=1 Tax=Polycladidibacter hongkongensis TaxID=1647556 RepID=UPI000837744C|nr:phosphoribosylamine--glycine ligase [Pseudovibrio hongkongensis]